MVRDLVNTPALELGPAELEKAVRDRLAMQQQVFPAMTGDRNTLRIGVIVLSAPR